MTLTLEQASCVVDAALAKGARRGFHPLSILVAETGE